MIQRILIPLDASPYTVAALEYGCWIAKRHHAELTGLAVVDILGIENTIGPTPYSGFYHAAKLLAARKKDVDAYIHQLLEQFEQKCQQEKVAHQQSKYQGIPSQGILHESLFYDLVTIGLRTYFDFEEESEPGKSLEKILDHSITPILAVPEVFNWTEKGIRTVIAFNKSLPSVRALQRFAQLARGTDHDVMVVMSDKEMEMANHYLDRAAAYLHAHSIPNVKKEWTAQPIIEAMEEKYLDWADLVVVGAHSKKGLVDFMVGSVVKYLIKVAKKPILLGQ